MQFRLGLEPTVFLKLNLILFLAALGLRCCLGSTPAAVSRGCPLAAMLRLLTGRPLCCGAQGLEPGLSSCWGLSCPAARGIFPDPCTGRRVPNRWTIREVPGPPYWQQPQRQMFTRLNCLRKDHQHPVTQRRLYSSTKGFFQLPKGANSKISCSH